MNHFRRKIKSYGFEFNLIWIHLVIGGFIFLLPAFSKLYGILILVFGAILVYSKKNRNNEVLMVCGYLVGSDVFLRMTGGVFFYEQTKYAVILFLLMGIAYRSSSPKSLVYIFYLLLLVPGIYITTYTLTYDINIRKAIAFNLSGPVCLGISAIYCLGRKVSFERLRSIMLWILLPILAMTVYLFLYTPSLQDVITGTQSNFEASGGFGPNQVSTVLGFGMFILITRYFLYSDNLMWKLINGGLFMLLTYRALITFSRGGVFTAILICVVFVLFILYYAKRVTKRRIANTLFILGIVLSLTWTYSNYVSNGLLEKRYNNQDALGREKEDLTTGRADLIETELEAFSRSPFFGIGVGNNKYYRMQTTGIESASHNEISRILAEHGAFGIMALLILLMIPTFRFMGRHRNIFFMSFFLFWFLTINHSAMRIAAPAFIYGLSLLTITSEKNTLYRKQISR
ncbi:O-antigen ligase domain-containing protein [Leptobacterium flavescens]|uniref:O-antigen ligase domain-containing protein n=1 Tax=Leptobacterium flavescens TaxID=472055 RepID=A0A6P0UFY5_9FLAO|nr:O-antigen ligase family protein [Leptobacterium flavescens]NER12164.1 O-antigen ligase domain-containing protein [Leptobacterium flavescens]